MAYERVYVCVSFIEWNAAKIKTNEKSMQLCEWVSE